VRVAIFSNSQHSRGRVNFYHGDTHVYWRRAADSSRFAVAETVTDIGIGAKGDRDGVTSPSRPAARTRGCRRRRVIMEQPRPRPHLCPDHPDLNETAVRARDDVVDARPGGAEPTTYDWAGFCDRATSAAANGKRAQHPGHDVKIKIVNNSEMRIPRATTERDGLLCSRLNFFASVLSMF